MRGAFRLFDGAAAESAAKKGTEYIAKVKIHSIKPAAESARAKVRVHPGVAELVIFGLFVRIRQDFIGLVYFFQASFCIFVIWVQVRMVLFCQLSVCFFYFIVRSAFFQPKHFIIISFLLCHSLYLYAAIAGAQCTPAMNFIGNEMFYFLSSSTTS